MMIKRIRRVIRIGFRCKKIRELLQFSRHEIILVFVFSRACNSSLIYLLRNIILDVHEYSSTRILNITENE